MHESDYDEDELQLGARVCQSCGQPFVLIAKTDQERLELHTQVMQAVVEQFQLPGYLVIPDALEPARTHARSISPGAAPRELSAEEYGESQEQAFLGHRCAGG